MNNRANRDIGNPLAMPELSRLLGAPIVLQANTMWMLVSGILFFLTAWFAWEADLPKHTHLYLVVIFGVPLGLVLGYRAKRLKLRLELDGAQPLRTGLGVAWRTGVLWVLISAIGEYFATGATSATVEDFPAMFGLSLVAVSSSFLLAYGATAAVIAIRSKSGGPLGWSHVLNLLIGIGGFVIGIVQLFGNTGSDAEDKRLGDDRIATTDSASTRAGDCQDDQVVAGAEIICALGTGAPILPDGTYYRAFVYDAASNEEVTITMSSENFDAFLILGTGDIAGGSFAVLADNDDGGIGLGTDSRLSYTFSSEGTYTVVANTLHPGEIGSFTLRIDREE